MTRLFCHLLPLSSTSLTILTIGTTSEAQDGLYLGYIDQSQLTGPTLYTQHIMEVLIGDQSSCCRHIVDLLWLREGLMTIEADRS